MKVIAILLFLLFTPGAQSLDVETSDLLQLRYTPDFEEMRQNRAIRALVVPGRTSYFFDGAVQRGLSYDALQAFEKQINKGVTQEHLKTHIFYIPVHRDQLIPALLDGRGDIAVANLTIRPERQALVDFSQPIMKNVEELVVTNKSAPALRNIHDLAGKEIHVRKSSSYYHSLIQANIKLNAAGYEYMRLIPADEQLEDEDLLEMVNAGLIPAIVLDSHKASFWKQVFKNIRVQKKLVLRSGAGIGWAYRKNSPAMSVAVNTFVRKNRKGTLMGNILLQRYLQDASYVENSLSSEEMEKFQTTAKLFQQYAGEYEFDWLMLIAQGYQESRLDQSTRSSAGAVGVMQMLPSTAADKNVDIDSIHQLENNIHAGAKYMRFIRDRYFSDSEMDDMQQTLFSFAAYNAESQGSLDS